MRVLVQDEKHAGHDISLCPKTERKQTNVECKWSMNGRKDRGRCGQGGSTVCTSTQFYTQRATADRQLMSDLFNLKINKKSVQNQNKLVIQN